MQAAYRRLGFVFAVLFLLAAFGPVRAQAAEGDDGKLRIIVFGAHPDDSEIRAGGSAILWTEQGNEVTLVSATNGDIGHWRMSGGALAKRRIAEAREVGKLWGTKSIVFDIHDGELLPTLEAREEFTRAIRRAEADIVIGHRPNDYHPDHRYTGVLMQDSAYMVTVPFFCPDVPALKKNPVFLYSEDRFQEPNPFVPDVVVAIDRVVDKKAEGLALMESQFVEGGANGSAETAPKNEAEREAKRQQVRESFKRRAADTANRFRDKLIEIYGEEAGKAVKYAEAFQVCEYGRQPSAEELRKMFPVDAGKK